MMVAPCRSTSALVKGKPKPSAFVAALQPVIDLAEGLESNLAYPPGIMPMPVSATVTAILDARGRDEPVKWRRPFR